ncbi:tail fiber assembly protein [Musicola paradisiaca]|uniref:Tail assembly chaperone gp38 n=1 Tax=Musicola paradisiaca (strain Ech703) TaxID=579405 RepID=C6C6Z1_MUSP7|nr:tail fiber assembly protein [Musicola paradisiaca]ACS85885.1 tail assembly chaperone gp38 [Musicola paradisiaca Ech703]
MMATLNDTEIQLNTQGLSMSAGYITVYHIAPQTREYIGSSREFLMEGVGIPAYSFIDTPPDSEAKQAIVRSEDGVSWVFTPDYRGKTAYNKQTRQSVLVTQPGELSDQLTLLSPTTDYDVWQDDGWVTDAQAQKTAQVEVAKAQLADDIAEAEKQITVLHYAVDLNIATEQETQRLADWKTYLVLLNRVDVSEAPSIDWPTIPA